VLKVVLTSTNGNALSMKTACESSFGGAIPGLGWGDSEQAILGFFHATNALVQGLAIQADPNTTTTQSAGVSKAICFASNSPENGGGRCQNFRVSGCWFGVNPTTRTVAYMADGVTVATPTISIATYNTDNAAGGGGGLTTAFNFPGTVGVSARSANPRAEFNVFVTGYGFDSAGLQFRVSGNFFNVLPDGVTVADMSVLNSGAQASDGFFECGGNNSDLTVGTDGDGVNDADEGNIFGPWSVGTGSVCINNYGANGHMTNVVVAGNYFNVDIHGNPFGILNAGQLWHSIKNVSTIRFGSDFNGVSDDLEANKVSDYLQLFNFDTGWPNNKAWVSMRGNSLVNSASITLGTPPLGDGQTVSDGQNVYTNFIDVSGAGGTLDIIPVVGAGTTTTALTGTCGKPLGSPYTRVIVDLYEADTTLAAPPQGKKWLASYTDNGALDSNPAVGAFTFNTAALGIAHGTKVVIAVTYSKDTQPAIGSFSHAGNQTTVSVAGGAGATYGVQKASTVTGPYTFVAATAGGAATFADNNPASFYRVTGPAATGQTSPFSAVFTIP
jgi:hypothetical protein